MGIGGVGEDIQMVPLVDGRLNQDAKKLAREFVLRRLGDDPEAAQEIIQMLGVEEVVA